MCETECVHAKLYLKYVSNLAGWLNSNSSREQRMRIIFSTFYWNDAVPKNDSPLRNRHTANTQCMDFVLLRSPETFFSWVALLKQNLTTVNTNRISFTNNKPKMCLRCTDVNIPTVKEMVVTTWSKLWQKKKIHAQHSLNKKVSV